MGKCTLGAPHKSDKGATQSDIGKQIRSEAKSIGTRKELRKHCENMRHYSKGQKIKVAHCPDMNSVADFAGKSCIRIDKRLTFSKTVALWGEVSPSEEAFCKLRSKKLCIENSSGIPY